MEKIIVLGTGAGISINCYSTCFLLENDDKYMLVDTGSGNQILNQLKAKNIDIDKIHDIFISHKHIDHLLGIIPLLRYIVQQHRMKRYNGKLNIYCDDEIKEIIDTFMSATFHKVHIDLYKELVIYNFCKDYKKFSIIGYDIEVIDLHSNECIQYGFKTILNNGKNIAFLGDVPCSENICNRINNFDWILHEAFCLEKEEPIFKAREKNHSVVKDVAEKMEMMKAKNLILWHTIDNDIKNRKKLYIEEAKKFFLGNVYVPNDLEEVIL